MNAPLSDDTVPAASLASRVALQRRSSRAPSKSRFAAGMVQTLLLSTMSGAAFAQSASPASTIELGTIVVEAERMDRSEGPGVSSSVLERFKAMPGGVSFIPRSDYADSANLTVSKALRSAPGVVVQDFFGGNDQPRIQIRGSGLQQNPVERGILVLQDGLPLNRADGSYIVGFANPGRAQAIEVYRGYMANRLGATVLGGALNFVSPTGSNSPGAQLSISGGSFGQLNVNGQAGFEKNGVDGMLQIDASRSDGFRAHNSSDRVSVGGNVGVALSDNVKTRLFAGYTALGFDVSGPLSKTAMYANPRQVSVGPLPSPIGFVYPGPNVTRDQPRRDAYQFLVGSRTTATFGPHVFDFGLGYTYTDDTFRFPISSGVRTTRGGDFTGMARYSYNPAAATLPLFEATAQYVVGSADRGYYINQLGVTGAQFGHNKLSAQTLSLSAGFNVPVWKDVTLSPGLSYAYAKRDNTDLYALPLRPTIAYNPANPFLLLPNGATPTQSTSYSRAYGAWSPSMAASWRLNDTQTLFVAGSRSFEPPTHDDLLATYNGTPNSSAGRPTPGAPFAVAAVFTTPALKAQTATTIEGGWRGRADRFSWDVVAYYSWIRNELLSLRDATGASIGAINADRTTHFGVELGAGATITDEVSARIAYTYQDFRFVSDPVRGSNRLAGAPPHLVYAQLQYNPFEAWTMQAAARWSPGKTPVDNMNTLYADPYVVVDLRSEYKIDKNLRVFGEVTNVFNKTYASSTLIVDQARPDQAAFLPGEGRAFRAGARASF